MNMVNQKIYYADQIRIIVELVVRKDCISLSYREITGERWGSFTRVVKHYYLVVYFLVYNLGEDWLQLSKSIKEIIKYYQYFIGFYKRLI